MNTPKPLRIEICMGSSCFARGNERNLARIEQIIARHRLDDRVELVGVRCMGHCDRGPNLRIGETTYHAVDEGTVVDLLRERLGEPGA